MHFLAAPVDSFNIYNKNPNFKLIQPSSTEPENLEHLSFDYFFQTHILSSLYVDYINLNKYKTVDRDSPFFATHLLYLSANNFTFFKLSPWN